MKGLWFGFLGLLRRIWRWLRDLVSGPEVRECAACGRQLEPEQTACPDCAEKEKEARVTARPAVKPLVLPPLARGQSNPSVLETGRPRLAIDLGTSASAVGFMESAGKHSAVHLVDFGRLGEGRTQGGPSPRSSLLIGSEIFDGNLEDGEKVTCLGRVALQLYREQPGRGRYHTSVKRALEAHTLGATGLGQSGLNPHLSVNLQRLVVEVFTELLLLAVVPERSATLRCAVTLGGGDEEPFVGVGLPLRVRGGMDHWIRQAGLELFITVPNSFSRHEIDVLRNGANAAALALFEAVEATPDQPIRIHTLREAEAIAWWEQFADREQAEQAGAPGPGAGNKAAERWLVFDMGAGTTDLALVEVQGSDVRLIRRSGVPLGGDDVDLAMLLHLADADLREAVVVRLLEGAAARAENLDVTFGGGQGVRITPARAAETLDRVVLEVRQLLRHEARVIKEAWSGFIPPRVEQDWVAWLKATLDLAEVEGKDVSDLSDEALLDVPFWSDRYRLFVHLVTVGCCQTLVEEGAADQQVDRVLLSGRSAFLPGIERCLRAALGRAGLFGERTRWGWPSSPPGWQGDAPMDAKLAVVRGAAVFSAAGHRRTAPARLADAITAEIRFSDSLVEEVIPVIPRNTQLDARGQCRRLYRLADQAGAELPIRIYRQRVPEEIVDLVDDLMLERLGRLRVSATRLCRRPLAVLNLSMGGASEYWLGFQVDEQNSRVDLFVSEGGDELARVKRELVGLPADPTNPVTGLHSDWLWGGRMR